MKKSIFSLVLVAILVLSTQFVYASTSDYFNIESRPFSYSEAKSNPFGINSDSNPNAREKQPSWYVVSVKPGVVADKTDVINALEQLTIMNESSIMPFTVYPTKYLKDDYSLTYSDGKLQARFNDQTHFETPFLGSPTGTAFYSGASYAYWTGQNPFYMDKVSLTDYITFKGIAMSVSANPSGGSVSGSSTARTVTMTSSKSQEWTLSHIYNNIQATGMGTSTNKRTEAAFTLGTTTRFSNAYDSASY